LRRVRATAPLKPAACGGDQPTPRASPSRSRDGSIEAVAPGACDLRLGGLRRVRATAPLKLIDSRLGSDSVGRLRRVRATAPLKLNLDPSAPYLALVSVAFARRLH